MRRKLLDSILFNYIGAIAAALGPLLVVPVYLSELGPAQWGLMNFALTMIVLLTMVDGGLSQVMCREFALLTRRHGPSSPQVQSLWRNCCAFYGIVSVAFGAVATVCGDWLARRWLNLGPDLTTGTTTHVLMLSGLLVTAQLLAAPPRSLLLALERYRSLNVSIALGHVFRFGGGALVVWSTHSVQLLLLWYVVVVLTEGVVRYGIVKRAIALHSNPRRISWLEICRLVPASAVMSSAVILSGFATQIDKIILSKMVPLDQLGIYAIASNVALGILSLTYPIIQAIFPTLLARYGDKQRIRSFFRQWLVVAVAGATLIMIFYAELGEFLLNLWLRNAAIAVAVYPVLFVLLIGTLLNVVYQVGYIGWMLDANYRMPLIVNASSLVVTLLLAPVLVRQYGIVGAAVGWLSINVLGLLFSLTWFRKIA